MKRTAELAKIQRYRKRCASWADASDEERVLYTAPRLMRAIEMYRVLQKSDWIGLTELAERSNTSTRHTRRLLHVLHFLDFIDLEIGRTLKGSWGKHVETKARLKDDKR